MSMTPNGQDCCFKDPKCKENCVRVVIGFFAFVVLVSPLFQIFQPRNYLNSIYPVAGGAALALLLTSVFTAKLMKLTAALISMEIPEKFPNKKEWKEIRDHNTAGALLGPIETLIFFISIYIALASDLENMSGIIAIGGWLTMKTAFFWRNTNLGEFPKHSPEGKELDYLKVRLQLGTLRVSKALIGTGANLIFAFIGGTYASCPSLRWWLTA